MRFRYTATKEDGTRITGEQEAADKFALARERKKEGETVVVTEEVGERARFNWSRLFARRVSLREKVAFARNLSGMVGAGLPLSRALAVLERQTTNERFKSVIAGVIECISKGATLTSALALFPAVFPPLIVSMAKAGEESGNLAGALLSAGEGLDRIYALARKVRGALIYPAIVIFVMIASGVVLFIFVIPQLVATFAEIQVALPFSTRLLIFMSDLFKQHGLLLAALVLCLAVGLLAAVRTARGRRMIDFVLLRLPIIAPILREANAARTAQTLSSLLSAGVPIVGALQITAGVIGNVYYQEALAAAGTTLERGEPISGVLRANETLFPPLLAEMVAVGEETGKLSGTLKEAGLFFEGEVEQKTKNLSTIIEPALMIVVGVAVAFFAFAMITPMYSLMNTI